ncbi:MAG: 2-hydroxychromene-2-carboxylate isomerase [Pseudomonadota bacterium]
MALTFWYDFSSSYAYLAAMRLEAEAAGAPVVWRPFLLGPIFTEAGYGGSPNLVGAAKAAYMWRDIGRAAAALGLPFVKPAVFPQKSVLAGRVALAAPDDERPRLTRAIFTQTFAHGRDIADPAVVADAIAEAGCDANLLDRASEPMVKQALFDAVDDAKAAGVFGAPTFMLPDGELYWGNERMAEALAALNA